MTSPIDTDNMSKTDIITILSDLHLKCYKTRQAMDTFFLFPSSVYVFYTKEREWKCKCLTYDNKMTLYYTPNSDTNFPIYSLLNVKFFSQNWNRYIRNDFPRTSSGG